MYVQYRVPIYLCFVSLFLPHESHWNIGFRFIKKSAIILKLLLSFAAVVVAAAAADVTISFWYLLLPLGNTLRLKYITDVNEKNALMCEKSEVKWSERNEDKSRFSNADCPIIVTIDRSLILV